MLLLDCGEIRWKLVKLGENWCKLVNIGATRSNIADKSAWWKGYRRNLIELTVWGLARLEVTIWINQESAWWKGYRRNLIELTVWGLA